MALISVNPFAHASRCVTIKGAERWADTLCLCIETTSFDIESTFLRAIHPVKLKGQPNSATGGMLILMETHSAAVRFLLTFVTVSAIFLIVVLTLDGNVNADAVPGMIGAGVPLGLLSVVKPQWLKGRNHR